MAAPKILANYDQLVQIAQRFGREAEATQRMLDSVRQAMSTLEAGDWVGQGASAFYAEMNSAVLPSLTRLTRALADAQYVTIQVRREIEAAEAAAAAVLNGQGTTGGASGGASGGAPGQPGDGVSTPSGLTGVPFIDGVTQNIEKSFKAKAKFTPGKAGQFGVDLFSGSVWGDKFLDGHGKWDVAGGSAGIGLRQIDGKWIAGASAEAYGARGKLEGALAGDKQLGWTGGVEAKALSANGFAGYRDGSVGAEVGVNLVSAKAETGVNIAGANIGVSGEIGLKLELGLQIGKNTEVKLGPFSFGFSFGGAKD